MRAHALRVGGVVIGACRPSADLGDPRRITVLASDTGVVLAEAGAPASAFPAPQRPVADIVAPRWSNEDDRDNAGEAERVLRILGAREGMHVADIGAGKTYAYDVQPGGELTGKRLFCNLGSDGMTLDAEGNVYLTGKGVTVFDKAGQQIEHLDIPEGWTANVTFGGTNNDLLFITASKSVYGARLRVKGAGRVVQK